MSNQELHVYRKSLSLTFAPRFAIALFMPLVRFSVPDRTSTYTMTSFITSSIVLGISIEGSTSAMLALVLSSLVTSKLL